MNPLLEYKLDILKLEIETINRAILDKDNASKQLKTWAISLWTATTTLTGIEHFTVPQVGISNFQIYSLPVPVTAIWALATLLVPITFLILEVYQRRVQRKFVWRARKIHEFLNDRGPSISRAFQANAIEEFRIYDPAGEHWRREIGGDESYDFERFIGFWTVIRIPNVYILYLLLAVLSITLAVAGVWIRV